MNRRIWLTGAALGLTAPQLKGAPEWSKKICLFTDHLAGFDYGAVARMIRELGLSGPDLTVRRGGLVTPERVKQDLPRAVAAFREQGLSVPMITTTITSTRDPFAKDILETAASLGIGYYKLGYFPYKDLVKWRETIDDTCARLKNLAALNQQLGLKAGMHNHAGDSVGCSLWDSWKALEGVDSQRVGFYFDPAQAAIEGGKTGWKLNFRRIAPKLLMVACKDFVWEKAAQGWRTKWVPLGEGMVPWAEFGAMLKTTALDGPVSLHIEYDPGGVTLDERYHRSLDAAQRDLKMLLARLA